MSIVVRRPQYTKTRSRHRGRNWRMKPIQHLVWVGGRRHLDGRTGRSRYVASTNATARLGTRTYLLDVASTIEGRDGAPTRGVVRAPSSMSSRSMLARITSRGAARSSHVAWMRTLAASKRLDNAILWRGRSSARELAADSSARIAGSCRRQSSTSASALDSAACAAPSWRHLSSDALRR